MEQTHVISAALQININLELYASFAAQIASLAKLQIRTVSVVASQQ